jgi:3-oxoacyl-[acyl-carrier protein] reductase
MALLTQEFLPQFKEQNSGNIINIEEPIRFYTRFSFRLIKIAVRGMTQSWQAELRKYNIRVTLVNPSATIYPQIARKSRRARTV